MKMNGSTLLPIVLASSLLGFSPPGAADAVDINLNNDAALFRYLAHDERGAGNFGKREMDVGLLYTDDNYVGMFGAQVIAEAGATIPELEAGVGLKIFGTRFDSQGILSLALGGQVKYSVPPHRRVVFGAEGFYSPSVVTSSRANSFSFLSVYAGYEVVPDALVYVGYRDVSVDLRRGGNTTIDSGGHFGVRFAF